MADNGRDFRRDDAENLSARLASSIGRTTPRSPSEALQPEAIPPPPSRSSVVRHPLVVFLNFMLTIAVMGAVVAGGSVFVAKRQFERPGALETSRAMSVDRGAGLSAIAERLQREGIIASKWLFMAGVWMNKQQSELKAGEYLFPAHASMREIMDTMVSGRGILYAVTIPEGLTSGQIVERLLAEEVLVGEIAEIPPEGSLLPDTYKFTRGDTRQNLIDRMRRDHESVVAAVWGRRADDLPVKTPEELVILASIVEKETSLADERSRVAAVFINRLRLNMRLQSDPTVIYAKFQGAGKPRGFMLSRSDLDTDSPYNTYVVDGLPPGPIANVGRASLEAVANPSRTRDLFFVADGTGGHTFAETYEAHLRNVARWREINQAANAVADGPAQASAPATAAAAASALAGPTLDAPLALSPTGPVPDEGPIQLQPNIRP